TLIAALDAFREAGGDLKLAGAPPQARLVLERLGVHRIIQQFPTSQEAFKAFEVPIQDYLSQGGLDVFVTAVRGKVFHASGCSRIRRLTSVRIHATKKAARDAGLKACRRCGAE
ncbi:MAG TPA: hypothetical protein VG457_02375, partial [Planctomycetota bacterium]|nr:hypothetical protein [Planctomycetota bacterium]